MDWSLFWKWHGSGNTGKTSVIDSVTSNHLADQTLKQAQLKITTCLEHLDAMKLYLHRIDEELKEQCESVRYYGGEQAWWDVTTALSTNPQFVYSRINLPHFVSVCLLNAQSNVHGNVHAAIIRSIKPTTKGSCDSSSAPCVLHHVFIFTYSGNAVTQFSSCYW